MTAILSSLSLTSINRAALILLGGIVLMLAVVSYRYYAFRRRFPPGPPGFPLVRNLLEMSKSHPQLTRTELHKNYRPIFSMQFGLSTVIFLGTQQVARDLFEKRSNIYSSRPRPATVSECISQGNRFLFLP